VRDRPPGFEWDPAKRAMSERRPNRPTFPDAATAFRDPMALEAFDAEHSGLDDDRYRLLGLTATGRLVTVTYVIRGQRIRIISARLATKRERHAYFSAPR
jgi:uncharacterized DUF497 family protein